MSAEVELDGIELAPAASSTRNASAVTSGPIPSPPITAIRWDRHPARMAGQSTGSHQLWCCQPRSTIPLPTAPIGST